MRKVRNLLSLVLALITISMSAIPAGAATGDPVIAVLPFQVNAGEDLAYLADSLPELLIDRLNAQGIETVPYSEIRDVIQREGVTELNVQTARDLALLAGANYAVYGSFSQLGETLSIDSRLVEAFGTEAVKPIFVVKDGLINILPAVEELSEKVRQELARTQVIADIRIEGTRTLDDDVVLMRLKINKGDTFDRKALNEEIRRVYELGYFNNVSVAVDDIPEGKIVTFRVDEKPRIMAIGVIGAEELDSDDILAAISTKTGGVLNPKLLADDLNKVRELYRKEGYYLAEVSHELEQKDKYQARLNIVVKEGKELYIQGITINGVESLDEDDIKDELALSERGAFSFITGSGVLQEDMLAHDTAVIERYYGDRGFLNVRVGEPRIDFTEEGIFIEFDVIEGDRYKVGEVTFRGDMLETPATLLEITEIDDLAEQDEWFKRSQLSDDSDALARYYSDYGYAFADAGFDLDADEENKRVNVSYRLTKKQKVFIRRVTIEGNTKTRDNVIRRQLRLADGDLYSGSKLNRSNVRLNKMNIFKAAEVEPVPTGNPDELDLRVKVQEKSTGMLTGGIGYSSANGVFIGGQIYEQNLFGKGYYLGLNAGVSGSGDSYSLNFYNPSIYDSLFGAGIKLYHTTYDYDDYDKRTIGGQLSASYPLGEYTRSTLAYRLENYEVTDVDDDANYRIKTIEGNNWASVLSLSTKRDTTDRPVYPLNGTITKLDFELGGGPLQGDDDFFKSTLSYSQYYQLFGEHVFHFRGKVGYVAEITDDPIPVFERFQIGGINSVRGYESGHIAPRDDSTNDIIGGNKMAFVNVEYIFPLLIDMGIKGVVFFDAGNAWLEDDWDLGEIKKGVGGGIRWNSPFGPLRIEYGYGLDEIEGEDDDRHQIEFTVGTPF